MGPLRSEDPAGGCRADSWGRRRTGRSEPRCRGTHLAPCALRGFIVPEPQGIARRRSIRGNRYRAIRRSGMCSRALVVESDVPHRRECAESVRGLTNSAGGTRRGGCRRNPESAPVPSRSHAGTSVGARPIRCAVQARRGPRTGRACRGDRRTRAATLSPHPALTRIELRCLLQTVATHRSRPTLGFAQSRCRASAAPRRICWCAQVGPITSMPISTGSWRARPIQKS